MAHFLKIVGSLLEMWWLFLDIHSFIVRDVCKGHLFPMYYNCTLFEMGWLFVGDLVKQK